MEIIDIYDTSLRDLENLLLSQIRPEDIDQLFNGLIVTVKALRLLEARVNALTESTELIRRVIADP